MNYDVVIIGSGCAGLSCGALLSKEGYSVLVVEKNQTIGGRAHVISKDGFKIDYGLHVNRFGKQSKCNEVMRKLNKKFEFLHLGKPVVFYEGEFYNFPSRPYEFLKVFLTKSRFLSIESKLKFLKIFLFAPFANPKKFISSSLYDFLEKYKPTQEMQDIISLFCGIAFICPDIKKISALEVGDFFRKAFTTRRHITYVKGGWEKILFALKDEIEKNGKILTGCKVEKVEIQNDIVSKVITQEGEYTASAYICTVPFCEIESIIDLDKLSPQLKKYAKEVEPTSGITLDFILSKPISSLDGIIITPQPLTIGYFVSNIDKSFNQGEKQLGQWFLYLTPEEIKNRSFAKEKIQALKNLLQEMFPGIWDGLLWERAMILDVVDGAVPKVGQGWRDRPQFTSNISNLFFAGDSTGGWGWGSEIAFSSAIKCSDIVKEYLKRKK